ncbi:hypothetical protein [Streptomyces axinellae]|uniref:Uncharacterized protein n=1 Tax=Streptomyces axinellae TaxID=552788 RepID=A0ABP6CZQ5_9ACTN
MTEHEPRRWTDRLMDAVTHSGPGYDLHPAATGPTRAPDGPAASPADTETSETVSGPHTGADALGGCTAGCGTWPCPTTRALNDGAA